MAKDNTLVIGIYGHPEYYPPTLNAIEQLCTIYKKVFVVHRSFLVSTWKYPSNCFLVHSDKLMDVKESERKSFIRKVFFFISFTLKLLSTIRMQQPKYVLLYDYFPMLSLFLIKSMISKKVRFWYHSHDVAELNQSKKYSLGWWSIKAEKRMFSNLDLFTYPSKERLPYFNLDAIKGRSFQVPNYPSIAFYGQYKSDYRTGDDTKLIYQGSISSGHGLEQISRFISSQTNQIRLHIAGRTSLEYQTSLQNILPDDRIVFENYVPYQALPNLTQSCQIGIGVNEPNGIIYKTGGSASNKIYEYAACGLPILYFDNEHYNHYLAKYEWAFATDLSASSLEQCISKIMQDYAYFSNKAKHDFREEFNFERAFEPVKKYLEQQLK